LENLVSGQELNPTFRRLFILLVVFGSGTLLFYLAVYFQSKNTQFLVPTLLILVSQAALIPAFLVSYHRERVNLAGMALLIAFAIHFVGHELIWEGITIYLCVSGVLLIVLAGILILPRQWHVWIGTALIYLAAILLINRFDLIQRIDPKTLTYVLIFIIGSTLLVNLAVVFLLILELPIHSIRVRLIGTFLLLVLVPVALVGTVATVLNAQNSQSAVLRQLEAVASLKESAVREWQSNLQADFETIASTSIDSDQVKVLLLQADQDGAANQTEYDAFKQRMMDHMQKTDFFEELMIVDLNGKVVFSTESANQGKNVKQEPFFSTSLEESTLVPPITKEGQGNFLYVAKPIKDSNGQTIAILAGKANLAPLNRIMTERIGLGDTGETYLVNRSHHLITDSLFEGYKAGESYVFSPAIDQILYKNEDGSGSYVGYRVKNVLGIYHWLPELGVALLAEQERSEALRSTYQGVFINVGLMVASMLAALVIGYFATTRITNPLAKLVKTTEQIAAGNLQMTSDIKQLDEIGDLSHSFNSMTIQLRDWVTSLEQRVADRTRDLESRSKQLRIAAEVTREATAVQDLNELLRRAVNLIHDRFGYDHVAIYLVDDQAEYAVFMAGTGEAGKTMLARGHRLKIGEMVGISNRSMISYVAQSGQPRISLDVRTDPGYYLNPLLPETKSEAALPLKVGTRIIGVIDFQSTGKGVFDEETAYVLQIVSDQLAIAVLNIRLLEEMTRNVEELQRMYGTYTQESWKNYQKRTFDSLNFQNGVGYRHRRLEIEPISGETPLIQSAIRMGQPVIQEAERENEEPEAGAKKTLAVPIRVRGQTIGAIEVQFEGQTLSPDIVSMYEEVASRLALILENARLLQEAQNLARREQQINLLSTKIRNSVNLDTILQNTVRELGKAFGPARTFIYLGDQTNGGEQAGSLKNQAGEGERVG
jgi:GAF domain-containing protein/HAMP domain-containing protein